MNEDKGLIKNEVLLMKTYNINGKQFLITQSFITDIINEIKIAINFERISYLKRQLADK